MRRLWPRSRSQWIGLISAIVGLFGLVFLFGPASTHPIDSYAACVKAGYPVSLSEPPVCRVGKRAFVGPQAAPTLTPPSTTAVGFTLLVSGDSRGEYPRQNDVIRNQPDWLRYWRAVHAGITPVPPLLPVDFSHDTVVAASSGPQATGGYNLRVASVATSSAGTVVDVVETVPTITCPVTQAQTNPYTIVRVPQQLPEPVIFRLTSTKRRC